MNYWINILFPGLPPNGKMLGKKLFYKGKEVGEVKAYFLQNLTIEITSDVMVNLFRDLGFEFKD